MKKIFPLFASLLFCFSLGLPATDACGAQTRKTEQAQPKAASAQKNAATTKKSPGASQKTSGSSRKAKKKSSAPATPPGGKTSRKVTNVPIPVNYQGRLDFRRSLQIDLSNGADWMLKHQSLQGVGDIAFDLGPSYVSGVLRLEAGVLPEAVARDSLRSLREQLQDLKPKTAYDVEIDLRNYETPEAVAAHMRAVASLVPAETWLLGGVSGIWQTRPGFFDAAKAEARAQGRRLGVMLFYGSPVPPGVDFAVISGLDGEEETRRQIAIIRRDNQALPILVQLSEDSFAAEDGNGYSFVHKKTPAERRMLIMDLAKLQSEPGVYLLYPLFGPEYPAGRAYDSTRDEFMLDTIRRMMEKYNK